MAGLPGTGKSALAARLAGALGGVVLDKDQVRAALFPPPALDYSTAQDDLCMAAIYRAAAHLHTTTPGLPVIIDGRTFLRASHLGDLLALAAPHRVRLRRRGGPRAAGARPGPGRAPRPQPHLRPRP